MGTEVGTGTRCGQCATPLTERSDLPVDERTVCPRCGSLARRFEVELCSQVHLRSTLRTRARTEQGRWFLEQRGGWDFWRSAGRWMDKVRRIDREANWYEEVVIDPETGGVVHEVHEP